MEFTTHEIGFYLVIVTTAHLAIFWLGNWAHILSGIKGDDGKYQLAEVIGYISLVVWPGMLMADSYFGFRASAEAWMSINIVISVSILHISYKHYLHKDKDKEEEKKEVVKEP